MFVCERVCVFVCLCVCVCDRERERKRQSGLDGLVCTAFVTVLHVP